MFIDVTKCSACRGCQTACKNWNELPGEMKPFTGNLQTYEDLTPQTYTIVTMEEKGSKDDFRWLFRKHQCLHCTEAACVKVCPKNALSHSPDGSVIRNYARCIGCGYCAINCPFQVPKIDKTVEKQFKCHRCHERIGNDLLPACAKACPFGAIQIGDADDILALANARLGEVKADKPNANLYGTDFLGGTNTFYLLAEDPSSYGLPKNPTIPAAAGLLKDIIQPFGKLLPIGAAGAVMVSLGLTTFLGGKDDKGHTKDEKGGMSNGK